MFKKVWLVVYVQWNERWVFFQEQQCDFFLHCFSSHVSTLTACANACSATVHASYHVRTDTWAIKGKCQNHNSSISEVFNIHFIYTCSSVYTRTETTAGLGWMCGGCTRLKMCWLHHMLLIIYSPAIDKRALWKNGSSSISTWLLPSLSGRVQYI